MISLKLWFRDHVEIDHFADTAFGDNDPSLESSFQEIGKEQRYPARCSVHVNGDRASLQYTAALNAQLAVLPGTMEIFFSDDTRQNVDGVTWQPEGIGQGHYDVPFVQIDYSEGGRRFAVHQSIERKTRAVQEKKQDAGPSPACEICEFTFAPHYADGGSFIECHHLRPLAEMGRRSTQQADLALVCANCHRMIHRHIRLYPDDCNNWTLHGLRKALAYQP